MTTNNTVEPSLRIDGYEEQQDDRYDLFNVYFYGDKIQTMVTCHPDIVTQWITESESCCSHQLIIGLDIEWRPTFNRNQQNRVATLQLCIDKRCLIIQLLYLRCIPESLVNFLGNKAYKFVGVGVDNDVEKLIEDHDINAVDLSRLAANAYPGLRNNVGLKELSSVVLGREIVKPKRITMGRWDAEWLNTDQIQYACVDAFVSFEIGKRLINS